MAFVITCSINGTKQERKAQGITAALDVRDSMHKAGATGITIKRDRSA